MVLVVFIVLIVAAVLWWIGSERALSRNERAYLRRRGYAADEAAETGPPITKDARLFSLIESLADLSPVSRQRAAEDLSRMCAAGQRDPRMFSSLITALDDSDASVRSAVAVALGSLGDTRAVEPLKQKLQSDDSIQVRAAARKALEKIG